jgi:hypothetical protein
MLIRMLIVGYCYGIRSRLDPAARVFVQPRPGVG